MAQQLLEFWWQVVVLIVLVSVIRKIKFLRISAKTGYALWLIPLIRLLIPIRFIPFPIVYEYEQSGVISVQEITTSAHSSSANKINFLIIILYLVIAVSIIVVAICTNYRQNKQIKQNSYWLKDNIYITPYCMSAAGTGIGKYSKIYISENLYRNYSQEEIDMIIAHEQGHIAHFDFLWNLLRCIILALFWYNPFIILAIKLSKIDAEHAADEYALQKLDPPCYKKYAALLVKTPCQNQSPDILRHLTFQTEYSNTFIQIKKRINNIAQSLENKETGKARKHLTCAITSCLILFFIVISFSYPKITYAQKTNLDPPPPTAANYTTATIEYVENSAIAPTKSQSENANYPTAATRVFAENTTVQSFSNIETFPDPNITTIPDPEYTTIPDPEYTTIPDPEYTTIPDSEYTTIIFEEDNDNQIVATSILYP